MSEDDENPQEPVREASWKDDEEESKHRPGPDDEAIEDMHACASHHIQTMTDDGSVGDGSNVLHHRSMARRLPSMGAGIQNYGSHHLQNAIIDASASDCGSTSNDGSNDGGSNDGSVSSRRSLRQKSESLGLPYSASSRSGMSGTVSISTIHMPQHDDSIIGGDNSHIISQLFRIWDLDANGLLDQDELFQGIETFVRARGLRLNQETFKQIWNQVVYIDGWAGDQTIPIEENTQTHHRLDEEQFAHFIDRFAHLVGVSTQDIVFALMEILAEKMIDQPMIAAAAAHQKSEAQLDFIFSSIMASGMALVETAADSMPEPAASKEVIAEDDMELSSEMLTGLVTGWFRSPKKAPLAVLEEEVGEHEQEEGDGHANEENDVRIEKHEDKDDASAAESGKFKVAKEEILAEDDNLHSVDQMWNLLVGSLQGDEPAEQDEKLEEQKDDASNATADQNGRWQNLFQKVKEAAVDVAGGLGDEQQKIEEAEKPMAYNDLSQDAPASDDTKNTEESKADEPMTRDEAKQSTITTQTIAAGSDLLKRFWIKSGASVEKNEKQRDDANKMEDEQPAGRPDASSGSILSSLWGGTHESCKSTTPQSTDPLVEESRTQSMFRADSINSNDDCHPMPDDLSKGHAPTALDEEEFLRQIAQPTKPNGMLQGIWSANDTIE